MAFDPRSLERLRELGRSLPQPLPKPEPKPPASARARAAEPRHKVETETDPEQLFRELMQASTDGTVPPHLMERLRQVEGQRRQRPTASSGSPTAPEMPTPKARRRDTAMGRPDPKLAAAHGDLYTAFQQLLLEDEEP
jgi:hypothetical protein